MTEQDVKKQEDKQEEGFKVFDPAKFKMNERFIDVSNLVDSITQGGADALSALDKFLASCFYVDKSMTTSNFNLNAFNFPEATKLRDNLVLKKEAREYVVEMITGFF